MPLGAEEHGSTKAIDKKSDTGQNLKRLIEYMAGGEARGRFIVGVLIRLVALLGLTAMPYLIGEGTNVISEPDGTVEELTRYVIIGAIAGAIYAYVKRQDPGNETMIDLGEQIHDGAMAFLRREYTVLAGFVAVVAVLLGLAIGWNSAGAYVFGALSSVAAGFAGMKAATRSNTRTSAAATATASGFRTSTGK